MTLNPELHRSREKWERRTRRALASGAHGLGLLVAAAVVGLAAPGAAATPEEPGARDLLLRERVVERLARSPSLRGSEIEVRVDGGRAVLSGAVLDQDARQRAIQIARKTRSILEVQAGDLRIAPERVRANWDEVADAALAERVARALAADVFEQARVEDGWLVGWKLDGNGWQFDVDVDAGMVTLEGSVAARRDVARAIERARTVAGVNAVHSELFVARDPIRFPHPYYPYPPFARPGAR